MTPNSIKMKILILAAEGGQTGSKFPRCFTKISESTTILERQLRMLNLLGFKNDQITVVIGSKGIWENVSQTDVNSKNRFKIRINECNSETNSARSLNLGLKGVSSDQKILIIHGDLYFDISHVEKMLEVGQQSAILSKQAITVGEVGEILETDVSGNLVGFGSVNGLRFPWHLYCGMVVLQCQDVKKYLAFEGAFEAKSAFEALVKVIGLSRFKVVDYASPKSGTKGAISNSIDLTGGSFANLSKRMLIRKQADEIGRQKLINEILWLQNLPTEISRVFPKVIDCDIVSPTVWFDMPWYNIPSLRKKILLGDIEVCEICENISNVLDFVFKKVYINKIGPAPENWVIQSHIKRVYDRLILVCASSKMMAKLIAAKTITINGKDYENLPSLFFKVTQCRKLLHIVGPTEMRMIHGDLHFQNILYGPNEEGTQFILADPRGEIQGSDIFYDIGKLWHSFNGLYDCIHTDQFNLLTQFSPDEMHMSAEFSFFNPQWTQKYTQIGEFIQRKVLDYTLIKSDKNWRLKAHFAELMHFSSVMIFHLKGTLDEPRASAMYLTAVRLMNEFFDIYGINGFERSKSVLGFSNFEEYMSKLKRE